MNSYFDLALKKNKIYHDNNSSACIVFFNVGVLLGPQDGRLPNVGLSCLEIYSQTSLQRPTWRQMNATLKERYPLRDGRSVI